jgi:hypothetical protein
MTRRGASYKAYRLVPGLRTPKSTRYYQRKKRENNARKMSNITIPNMNSQSLTVNFPIDRLTDKKNEVIDEFEGLLYNNEFNENEEPQERNQEIEKELLEIIEKTSTQNLINQIK